MFYTLRNKLNFAWFNFNTKSILKTASIKFDSRSSVVCVTQICHRDVFAYLLAIKSFIRFISLKKIYALDDCSLTAHDKSVIHKHINHVEIIPITEVENRRCPVGGCWERILFISDCVKDNYVVQLDSDTLTVDNIPEVIEAVNENRSFTLGTWTNQEIEPMETTWQYVASSDSSHVQIIAEKSFHKLPNFNQLKYVRGNAAFSGFSSGSVLRPKVEDFSQQMAKNIGAIWSNWGSEQVASNYIISNSLQAMVLPYPKYTGFSPEIDAQGSSLLHFIGAHRFKKGVYVKMAKDILEKLKAPYGTDI